MNINDFRAMRDSERAMLAAGLAILEGRTPDDKELTDAEVERMDENAVRSFVADMFERKQRRENELRRLKGEETRQ